MECVLCGKAIPGYSARFNNLRVGDGRSVDVCDGCIDAFVEWQGKRLAELFPTKAMKRRFGGAKSR